MTRKERKIKLKFYRDFIGKNKIKDGFMKRGVYGSVFNIPEKVIRSLKKSKNENHRKYMINTFSKIAIRFNSNKVLMILED